MKSRPERGLLDTSVFIAPESGRGIEASLLPESSAVSAITVAELHVGVLAAKDVQTRARRLETVEALADIETLAVDGSVAASWALLRIQLSEAGRRMNVNDLWIAATAHAHDLPVVTQDDDFEAISDVGGVTVVRV